MILSSSLLSPHSCHLQASATCECKRFHLTFRLKLLGSATKTVVLAAAILCLVASCAASSGETPTPALPAPHPPRGWVSLPILGGCKLSAEWQGDGWEGGLEIRRSKGQGEDLLLSPPHCQPPELLHRFCCSLSRKALVLIKCVVTACMSKQRLDARWKESDQKKKGACVGGSYLVSPAKLGICTSLCPQNIILISLSSRQFLK